MVWNKKSKSLVCEIVICSILAFLGEVNLNAPCFAMVLFCFLGMKVSGRPRVEICRIILFIYSKLRARFHATDIRHFIFGSDWSMRFLFKHLPRG
uniref:Uncharacterized protein n=1 Tax=Ixodes ricinus TaxID=34613 RepID=A0A147BIR8_IXORI